MGIVLMTKNLKRAWRYHTIKELMIKDFNKLTRKSHTLPDHHRMHIFRRHFADQVDDLASKVHDGSYLPS